MPPQCVDEAQNANRCISLSLRQIAGTTGKTSAAEQASPIPMNTFLKQAVPRIEDANGSATSSAVRRRRIALLGEPGSGKSTLLRWFVWQMTSNLNDPKWVAISLPVFVSLREWEHQPASLESHLHSSPANTDLGIDD